MDSKSRQGTWLDFTNKAQKQKQGYFASQKGDSIFKSPDTVMGKVGVVGSGKEMTSYEANKVKYHQTFRNEGEQDFKQIEKASLKRPRYS